MSVWFPHHSRTVSDPRSPWRPFRSNGRYPSELLNPTSMCRRGFVTTSRRSGEASPRLRQQDRVLRTVALLAEIGWTAAKPFRLGDARTAEPVHKIGHRQRAAMHAQQSFHEQAVLDQRDVL